MEHLYVTWNDYHRLIERLALQIHDSGWQFDSVIALARGGLRVGDILSRVFDKPMGVLTTSSYREDSGRTQGVLTIGESISSAQPVTLGRVLLADDLVDSGQTLITLMPEMKRRYPQITEIRTAVLWVKGVGRFKPDYMVDYLPGSPWIHQPFEIYEGCTMDQIRKGLVQAANTHAGMAGARDEQQQS